jgi:hypothetical protein
LDVESPICDSSRVGVSCRCGSSSRQDMSHCKTVRWCAVWSRRINPTRHVRASVLACNPLWLEINARHHLSDRDVIQLQDRHKGVEYLHQRGRRAVMRTYVVLQSGQF